MDNLLLDGKRFRVRTVSVHRQFKIAEGKNSGTALSGRVRRDILGTMYNYEMVLDPDGMSRSEYDLLYEALSAPVESHTITLPYGQAAITYEAYIIAGEDDLELIDETECVWWGSLSVTFYAMEPQRTP